MARGCAPLAEMASKLPTETGLAISFVIRPYGNYTELCNTYRYRILLAIVVQMTG